MAEIQFTIVGAPVPKARPRLGRRGRVYTPARTKDYEEVVALEAFDAFRKARMRPLEGPLEMSLKVFRDRAVVRLTEVPDTKRFGSFDLDNVLKAISDGLQGVAYKNDRQIVFVQAEIIRE